jgi:hypothetical protein
MCWNARVSLNTYLFSLFASVFAYFNNVISLSTFLYYNSFFSMQLLEYFTWTHLHDKQMNIMLSKIGLFIIFIQIPLFILSNHKVENNLKLLLIGVYLIYFLGLMLYFDIEYSMNKAPNGHLAWNWLKFPTFVIMIWVSFILGLLLYVKEYVKLIVTSILVISIYYTYYKTNTWGSLWCWISNLLSLTIIIKVFLKDFRN